MSATKERQCDERERKAYEKERKVETAEEQKGETARWPSSNTEHVSTVPYNTAHLYVYIAYNAPPLRPYICREGPMLGQVRQHPRKYLQCPVCPCSARLMCGKV